MPKPPSRGADWFSPPALTFTAIKEIEQEGTYKYLGMNEGDGIRHATMMEKIQKEYYRRVRMVLKSELNAANHHYRPRHLPNINIRPLQLVEHYEDRKKLFSINKETAKFKQELSLQMNRVMKQQPSTPAQ